VGLLLGVAVSAQAAVVLEDSFASFTLGAVWQAHGSGIPDAALGVVPYGTDGASLRLGTAPGAAGEVTGIETASSFPLAGVRLVRVTARLRPLNQTGTGDGGASDASAGVAVIGASGAFTRAVAGANRPTQPDWGDFYADSEGSADKSAAYVHFPPNDPTAGGGAEAFRTFVLEISASGTRLTTLASSGAPLATAPFDAFNPNLNLASFGSSLTVALFQARSDSNLALPEHSFGDVDSVKVEVDADMVTLLDDPFQPAAGGPGSNWEAAGAGLPNAVSDRINLDGTHLGLRLRTQDTSGATYGVQLVSPLTIPADATGVDVDFFVQPRNGGSFDARLLIEDIGDTDSLALSFNEFFPGGGVRRLAVLGSGGGGAFSQTSGEYAFGPGTFYHVLASVGAAGTKVQFKSEDLSTTLYTATVPQLTLANLLGSKVRLSILQADREHSEPYIDSPECLVDRLTVSVSFNPPPELKLVIAKGGNIIDDSKPSGTPHPGTNVGATWAAADTDAAGRTQSGVMQFSAAATNQIVLAADPDFNSTSGTIMFWLRSAGTTGSGSEGAMLFDRRPSDINGAPGAVLVQTDGGKVLFEAASGSGLKGYPTEVSQRINLDGTHLGYRMRTSDQGSAVRGVQLATPFDIPLEETSLAVDLFVEPRAGGACPARLVLAASGGKTLVLSLNQSLGGHARQFVASGVGGGGAFEQSSEDGIYSDYGFYHIRATIDSMGAAVELAGEDGGVVLFAAVVPELTIADIAGSSLQVYILQAANSASATEALVDNLTLSMAVAGAFDDTFEPPGDGPGANWVAAQSIGVAIQFQSVRAIADNRWHHIAVVYDQAAAAPTTLYIDGALDATQNNLAGWAWGPTRAIELGRSHESQWRALNGLLDDFRIYNRKLTAAEIGQAAGTAGLVDPEALAVRFDFESAPSGATLRWPGGGGLESTADLTPPIQWSPVPRAVSPLFIDPGTGPQVFYRALGL
jgi:hypothetical protein